MRRSALQAAGVVCLLCSTALMAQQYSGGEYDRDYSSGDQEVRRGYSGGQSGMYSDRQSSQSDWYGRRDADRFGRFDYDSGAGGQQQYGQTWGRDRDRQWMQGERSGRFQEFADRARARGVAVVGRLMQDDARVSGLNPNHKVVELQTRSGSSIFVDLGPAREAENLNLTRNQPILVHGRLVNVDGQRVLMAREVARVSQTTTISRPGQDRFSREQGGQQDIFGYLGESSQQDQAATQPAAGRSSQDPNAGSSRQMDQGTGQQQSRQEENSWRSSGQSGQNQNR